jgi:hypothetical protein
MTHDRIIDLADAARGELVGLAPECAVNQGKEVDK